MGTTAPHTMGAMKPFRGAYVEQKVPGTGDSGVDSGIACGVGQRRRIRGKTAPMYTPLRIVVMMLGAGSLLQGLGWIFSPATAAEGLGMPLLEGVGRSTQIGDFASFFLVLGGVTLLGSRPGNAAWLRFPAAMATCSAIGRTLAWALHDASFTALFIGVEVVLAVLLFKAAASLDLPTEVR